MIKMRSFPPPKSNKRKREMISSLSTSNLGFIEFPTKIRKKIDNKLRRDELNYLSYSLDASSFKFYLKKESDNLYSITRNKFLAFCGGFSGGLCLILMISVQYESGGTALDWCRNHQN